MRNHTSNWISPPINQFIHIITVWTFDACKFEFRLHTPYLCYYNKRPKSTIVRYSSSWFSTSHSLVIRSITENQHIWQTLSHNSHHTKNWPNVIKWTKQISRWKSNAEWKCARDQILERLTVVRLFHLASICRLRKIVTGQPNTFKRIKVRSTVRHF